MKRDTVKAINVGGLARSLPHLLLIALLFLAVFPQAAGLAYAAADPCSPYRPQIKEALANCDFESLLQLEYLLTAADGLNCPQVEKSLQEAECQYFFDCAVSALNRAYMSCDLKLILHLENLLLTNLSHCMEYKNIKEKLLGMKCLYFDTCLKKELEEAQKSCNWEKILQIEEFLGSEVLKDCWKYDRMMATLREYKCNSFNLCMLEDLRVAEEDCNLEKITQINQALQENLIDCANFNWMNNKLRRVKCNYGIRCAKQLEAAFSPLKCEPNKIKRLQELVPLKDRQDCPPREYQVLEDLARKLGCDYLDNCAPGEFKRQQEECDLEGIFQLEELLEDCQVQRQLKGAIKDSKPQIRKRCFQRRLDQAVQNCDLEAIRQWEELPKNEVLRDDSQREDLQQFITQSERKYFEHCLEPQLKSGAQNCNLGQIRRTAEKVRQELSAHPEQANMLRQAADSECLYFLNCTQRRLNEAAEYCNYEQIKTLKRLSKQEEIKHCPGYEQIEAGIPDALELYFYNCAQKALYKAYANCDWEGILRVEKMVEDDLKFHRDYQKIRVVVLEVKCSHFMSCLKEKLEKTIAARNKVKLEEFKQLIDQELAPCPNYPTLSRIIQEGMEKIH